MLIYNNLHSKKILFFLLKLLIIIKIVVYLCIEKLKYKPIKKRDMKATTVNEIKKALMTAQNYMADSARTGNSIYEQMANDILVEAGIHELKEPGDESFGGKLYKEFCGSRLYSRMSEKQAFWIAVSFAAANGLDGEVVAKYYKN